MPAAPPAIFSLPQVPSQPMVKEKEEKKKKKKKIGELKIWGERKMKGMEAWKEKEFLWGLGLLRDKFWKGP